MYHVNQKTGESSLCQATIKCPFGSFEEDHYETLNQARVAYSVYMNTMITNVGAAVKVYSAAKKASIKAEEKLQNEQDKVLKGAAEASSLIPLYAEVRARHFEERDARYKVKLATLEAGDLVETRKENKWAQTRGQKQLNAEYVRGEKPKIIFDGTENDNEARRLVKELASWREISQIEAKAIIDSYDEAESENKMSRDEFIVSEFQKASFKNWTKDRVYIDLETTSLDPNLGEIIEIGIVRIKAGTGEEVKYSKIFDMEDPIVRKKLGTGAQDIHGLSADILEGKNKFSDPEIQEEIGAILNDPTIVQVAHRDQFEEMWLKQNLAGYWETHDSSIGEPVVHSQDTMWLSKFLVHDTPRNTLEAFIVGAGGDYEDAHSALPDALMTHRAMKALDLALMKSKEGIRPTEAERSANY